jgi:putative tributyrin esterase
MGVAQVQLFSNALGKWTSYNVILPDEGDGPFPVVFQLHGLSDDHNAWLQRSNIVRHAAQYPFIIAFPDGGTHFYTNWKSSGRLGKVNYEDLIVTDITAHLKRTFNVTDGPWAIGGLSMGGYGAMKLGLKYAERFASIWSHSSAFDMRDRDFDYSLIQDPDDIHLVPHAERVSRMERPPVISFDCGTEDELLDENRWFHTELDRLGLEHNYKEHPGAHTWDYWDMHVREALEQHARVLGVGRVTS